MYGDIVEIAQNTLLIEGKRPSTIMKEPDIANSVVYKADDVLYLLDTGATPFFRERILKAIDSLKPFQKIILFNSHSHPDHVGNNSIINEIKVDKKEHYISQAGIIGLDTEKDFYRKFKNIEKYYDYLDGPTNFPATLLRFSKIIRILGEDIPLDILLKNTLLKFMPLEPSKDTALPLEKINPIKLLIGNTDWTGWNFEDHVYVMEARGHSPDEVVFYLPKVKVLFLADETFEFFNCWPDSSSLKVKDVIHKSIKLFQNKEAEILISGHTHVMLKGNDAVKFLNSLLKDYEEFTKQVLQIIKNFPKGITVNKIYKELKNTDTNSAIKKYLSIEFPKMPPFLKTVITSVLLEEGFRVKGRMRKKKFIP
ncbi:hypothetical protein Sgly_1571 [Syntrophobotulus glycolicus DSM 8271]|uniref:Metallo-beta-lactamase domain-containing protein n=1 Tax=Syntrophobotulus glycolicus (strain DSM 8271 / FlGlyR) TaxID=645991 RepID=F0SXN8_SYNGF|nr:MBL fold metallo-hydrolase [Syntrophobotulus glycolicus]ADY55871.1 hypothetical protein Sgly_1571 [Syntrophobotulus glycolicus DSM 8271]